ncbi:MAG: radical SAM protein, partial [Thermoplasmata archaeon]|nr:radical SAM protein [Thermoplasmata archaeon]
ESFNTVKRTAYPPLNLLTLASVIEDLANVKIIDMVVDGGIENLKKRIKSFDPDIIGITALTPTIYESWFIAKIAKENNPNCVTMLGGPHPSVLDKESLNSPYVDIIVRGEGEQTFREIVRNKGKPSKETKGVSFKEKGKIIVNEERELIKNLDELPLPPYHLVPMEKYRVHANIFDLRKDRESIAGIMTSRGCPFKCRFCASDIIYKGVWRARSPENVVEEISILRHRYKKREIEFMDDTFALDRKRAKRICELIKEENLDISWSCSTRVDRFDKELATMLREAGCYAVSFGIESGVQKTLDFLNKGITVSEIERAVKTAKKHGFIVNTSLILGIPGENREKVNETIRFINRLRPTTASFSLLTPYPGTWVYKFAEEKKLFITKDWSKYRLSEPVMRIPGFTLEELKKILRKAYTSFYLSPAYLTNVFASKPLNDLLAAFKNSVMDFFVNKK